MSGHPAENSPPAAAGTLPPPSPADLDGARGFGPLDEALSDKLNEIDLLGEEHAARFILPTNRSRVGPDAVYLHMSRNVHQLLLERTRAITIFLAVASLLWTASGFLTNAQPKGDLLVPIEYIQRWCVPFTSAACLVLAVIVALWLMRIRESLIYEVAKMNVLIGLGSARVTRTNPLSISSLVQLLISLAGGASAAVFVLFLLYPHGHDHQGPLWSVLIGLAVVLLLQGMYIIRIYLVVWSFHRDKKLQRGGS